jgi:aspartate/methionine/tyrosine aminotransferase
MNWAKTRSFARFSLATSGIMNYPLKDLGIEINELEISGPTYYGYAPLQKALAEKCGVNENCVAASIGTSMANHLVLAALLESGDEILVEEPTYEPILAVAKYLKANIRRFPRTFSEGFRIDPERIAKSITPKTKLIVITNFHNPSGVFTDQTVMKKIGKIAEGVGARVLVDEVYLECLFPKSGDRISSFHLGNQFIVTSSLTKAYGLSGLRCGWILAEPELIERMKMMNDLFSATPSHTSEILSIIALQKLSQIAERSKALLNTNRKLLQQFFEEQHSSLEVILPPSGTIAFPKLKDRDPEKFFTELREKYETLVVPGKFFEMPEHFRIGIGGPTETLTEGLARLRKALE